MFCHNLCEFWRLFRCFDLTLVVLIRGVKKSTWGNGCTLTIPPRGMVHFCHRKGGREAKYKRVKIQNKLRHLQSRHFHKQMRVRNFPKQIFVGGGGWHFQHVFSLRGPAFLAIAFLASFAFTEGASPPPDAAGIAWWQLHVIWERKERREKRAETKEN